MTTVPQNPIYFSYAWKGKDEKNKNLEIVVDKLYNTLKTDGFNVKRDKEEIEFGSSISDFMEEIGEGKLVLVFLSDKYVRSAHCLFELDNIGLNVKYKQAKFTQSVVPIPVEFVAFDSASVAGEYLDYWEKEESDWLAVKQRSNATAAQQRRYDIRRRINLNFGNMLDWLVDLNQSSIDMLSEDNFETIKQTIIKRLNA